MITNVGAERFKKALEKEGSPNARGDAIAAVDSAELESSGSMQPDRQVQESFEPVGADDSAEVLEVQQAAQPRTEKISGAYTLSPPTEGSSSLRAAGS